MNILVTGGAGFIGSCFVRNFFERNPNSKLVNLDKLTYAGNLDNLKSIETHSNYTFICGDISDRGLVAELLKKHQIDTILNFAAESHVDRSIQDAASFIQTNITGTHVLLEAAKKHGVHRFLQVSTDEVYGSLGDTGYFTEKTPLSPNSPYAASKASADLLCRSYFKTFDLPVLITRCSNNFGPYQYPEKLIPLFILNALQNKTLPLYGDGLYVRDWIHVEDHVNALYLVLEKGRPGDIYNIGARSEKKNVDIANQILKILKKPKALLQSVTDRLGHDRRYAIDSTKIENTLGWKPKYHIDDELPSLIEWYETNETWWKKILRPVGLHKQS
ncbi:MAG: dTDP-glucose 4,6-dehydratase [Deltaproteobacteria bacterium RIFCSPHIGHO2_02_FULL_40_11]|nr:MAG: dTDP-glucose 4,6-dehydratase [Deltaproteobacteria bacterium RIFCSPHIGHO2_02_FULL_40_11]